MKPILLASLLTFFVGTALAQENEEVKTHTYPVWSISKPVQTLQFRNSVFKSARVYTGNAWVMTKDVHQLQLVRNTQPKTYKVKLGNTPPSAISKGVARMQYERNNKRD